MTDQTTELIFGVDIDGVMADLHTPFREFVSEGLGRTVGPPQTWSMSEEWGLTNDELNDWFRKFTLERRYRDLPVVEGAVDALWKLSEAGVHLRIITHRLFLPELHDIFVEDTGYWLQRNNIPYWDICILGKGGRKFDVGADIYIDDGPHVIESLRAHHKPVLVYDRPYNRELVGLPRAKNWKEVEEFFTTMYGLDLPEKITFEPVPVHKAE